MIFCYRKQLIIFKQGGIDRNYFSETIVIVGIKWPYVRTSKIICLYILSNFLLHAIKIGMGKARIVNYVGRFREG